MLVEPAIADAFLATYKRMLWHVNDDEEPESISDYHHLRAEALEGDVARFRGIVDCDFVDCLKRAVSGEFIFLKKYKPGYVFYHIENQLYYQVRGLNSAIENLAEEYSVVETLILPYRGNLICDGLIAKRGVYLGTNMARGLREGYWAARKSGGLVHDA